jgi:hypothetical protein
VLVEFRAESLRLTPEALLDARHDAVGQLFLALLGLGAQPIRLASELVDRPSAGSLLRLLAGGDQCGGNLLGGLLGTTTRGLAQSRLLDLDPSLDVLDGSGVHLAELLLELALGALNGLPQTVARRDPELVLDLELELSRPRDDRGGRVADIGQLDLGRLTVVVAAGLGDGVPSSPYRLVFPCHVNTWGGPPRGPSGSPSLREPHDRCRAPNPASLARSVPYPFLIRVEGKDRVAELGISKRVEQMMRDAEQEADRLRQNARAEAQRYVDEYRRKIDAVAEERLQQLTDLTESMAKRLEQLGQEADNLVAALRRTSEHLSRDVATSLSRRSLEAEVESRPSEPPPGS